MPTLTARVECPVFDSFRVQQIAGLFDVPLAEKCRHIFEVELPSLDEPWQIGVIVGPSGSGKSTVARQAFGAALYEPCEWPADRAVIDGFGDLPAKAITQLLTAVGFSSPPSWVKPYAVLSNGEKFRCDLARAILSGLVAGGLVTGTHGTNHQSTSQQVTPSLVVFDEFTSVVDRTAAQIGSAAVAKAIRGRNARFSPSPTPPVSPSPCLRFVAVTCHYDVLPWLEPDWVLDMATGKLSRGRLRRPEIKLELHRASRAAWPLFAKHHYLNPGLSCFAACYVATWNDAPVAFVAVLPLAGHKGRRRISRVVVLPDFQGVGIGGKLTSAVAGLLAGQGLRVSITTSHPAMIGWLKRAPDWKITAVYRSGGHAHKTLQVAGKNTRGTRYKASTGRAVVSATYVQESPHPGPLPKGEGGPA
jgi:GNAT superfamily N-acetyltransferase